MDRHLFSCLVMGIGILLTGLSGRADEPVLPGDGWAGSRYETLWTKSPFSVATPEGSPDSAEFSLSGIAQIDGVSYASLTEKKNSEHFLVSSDKPARGLTLVSITRGTKAADATAVLQKDGQSITLKVEIQAPAIAQVMPNGLPPGVGPAGQGTGTMNGMPTTFSRFPNQGGPPPILRRPPISHLPPPRPGNMQVPPTVAQ